MPDRIDHDVAWRDWVRKGQLRDEVRKRRWRNLVGAGIAVLAAISALYGFLVPAR